MALRTPIPLALLLALAAAPAAAEPGPKLLLKGSAASPVMTDARDQLAFTIDSGEVHVADQATRSSFSIRLDGCSLGAIGGGNALFRCSTSNHQAYPALVDVATTEVRDTPAAPTAIARQPYPEPALNSFQFQRIGDEWIQALETAYHRAIPAYFNWRTGEYRAEHPSARRRENLDAPGLYSKLCSPLRRGARSPGGPDAEGRFHPFAYRGKYGVTERGTAMTLTRCGGRTVRLGSCPCGEAQIGPDGLATWSSLERVHAYFIPTRRRFDWKVEGPAFIAQTRRRVYVTEGTPPRQRISTVDTSQLKRRR